MIGNVNFACAFLSINCFLLSSAEEISSGLAPGKGLMDWIYEDFVQEGSIAGGATEESDGSTQSALGVKDGTKVLVDVLAMDEGAESVLGQALEAANFETTACMTYFCSGWLPLASFPTLKENESVREIRPSFRLADQAGTIINEALRSLHVDLIREKIDPALTGEGLKIGILSDSFDFSNVAITDYAQDIASGDVPNDVSIVQESEQPGIDEGRGMAQLVHDLIPGAEIAFATANGGPANFGENIKKLADEGCDVIVDDIVYFIQPYFQDGPIAQAANLVASNGVPYFSSAGNRAADSWEGGPFKPSQAIIDGCPLYDFGNGDFSQSITVSPGTIIILEWDDPWFSVSGPPGAKSDINLVVFDNGNPGFIDSVNNIGGDPWAGVQFVSGGEIALGFSLCSGPPPNLLKWIAYRGVENIEYDTKSSTSFGHKNTPMVAGVGAAFYQGTPEFGQDPPILESFSSRGGTPILFNVDGSRKDSQEVPLQPRFVATDGNANTFFGVDIVQLPMFPNGNDAFYFFGTSAAAPNAAAVAILMLQVNPDLEPLEIYKILQDTAIDMNAPGFDFDSGFGYIDALAAINAALPPAPMGKKGRGGKRGHDDILSMPSGGKKG